MLQDLRALHAEVSAFRERLKSTPNVEIQNISVVSRRIEKELVHLESADSTSSGCSTNTPDLVRLWRMARSLPALCAFHSSFQHFTRAKSDCVTIDIVYRKGHAWLCRSSLKYRAFLTELANLPIQSAMDIDGAESSDDDGADDDLFGDANLHNSKIVQQAQKLVEVAGNNLKLGAMPHLTMYFPRILEECRHDEDRANVLKLFDLLERMHVHPVVEPEPVLSFELNVGAQIKDEFGNEEVTLAAGDPINFDLTTLFVLCSDISNVDLNELTETHRALSFQMQEEAMVPCLRDRIFPFIRGGRPIVCSPVAKHRFFEIVSELGSPYEKQRATCIFAEQESTLTCSQMSSISIHEWPQDIAFPVQVARLDISARAENVPFVTEYKTSIAQECFENCWYGRMLTLSANKQAVKIFREALFSWPDEVQPRPSVFLHAARSLTRYERATP